MNSASSYSFAIRPYKRRCRYWAKLVRAGAALPMPADVDGANSIPGPYLRLGEEELFCGDLLFEGEANHASKDRGWTYWVHYLDGSGELLSANSGWADFKARLKTASGVFDTALLKGSGDLAACVRYAHVQRLGGLDMLCAMAMADEARASMKRIAASAAATAAATAAAIAAASGATSHSQP